jgi:excisionase family DNA binding protein
VKLYYTVSEAALALNMSPEQVRSMIDLGDIQVAVISGGWKRIPRAEIIKSRGVRT